MRPLTCWWVQGAAAEALGLQVPTEEQLQQVSTGEGSGKAVPLPAGAHDATQIASVSSPVGAMPHGEKGTTT